MITSHFNQSIAALSALKADYVAMDKINLMAEIIATSIRFGGKLMIIGNGGSAADAQHIAAEFVVRLRENRNPYPAIALTTDSSILTAIGNDLGFGLVFSRQVRALGRPRDVMLALTTSGRSGNVLHAIAAAHLCEITTLVMTAGNGGEAAVLADHALIAPTDDTAVAQQVHMTAAHAICMLVEYLLAEDKP